MGAGSGEGMGGEGREAGQGGNVSETESDTSSIMGDGSNLPIDLGSLHPFLLSSTNETEGSLGQA